MRNNYSVLRINVNDLGSGQKVELPAAVGHATGPGSIRAAGDPTKIPDLDQGL